MAGSGNAARRLEAFYGDRQPVSAADGPTFAPGPSAASLRLEALRQYRETRDTGAAGLAADETKPNWVSIGPFAVTHGQAGDTPVVSGRVPGLAVSDDGQRVYVASANGGV